MSAADDFLDSKEAPKLAPVVPMSADAFLDAPLAAPKEEGEGEQAPADPGEFRAPTKEERIAHNWEAMTGGIFSSGPRARPAHAEGVKTEWSDMPHKVGGLVAEMALQPGNILAVATGRAFPTTAPLIGKGYAGYMLTQTARQAKGLYQELKNPDVEAPQKTFDTFAWTLQTALGLALGKGPTHMKFETGIADLKAATQAMPAEEANSLMREMHGKNPTELAELLQRKAAEAKAPEQVELLKSAADQAQKIADMEPKEVKKLNEAQKGWDEVLRTFAPAARGPRAEITAGSLREHGGELAQRADRAEAALSGASKTLMAMPEADRWAAVDRIEQGKPQANEDLQGFADTARKIMDTKRDEIRALGTGKLEHFIEDYFPHIWKDPEAVNDAMARYYARSPMLGPRSFLKERTIPTIAEGIAAGLEPVSTNPVDLLLAKGREMDRYIVGQKWMQEMKDREFVQFVRSGEKAPMGYTKIDDSIATVYGPRKGAVKLPSTETTFEGKGGEIQPFGPEDVTVFGQRIMGNYYAPDEVAAVANNYLSPGLRQKSAAFRAYLSVANSVNQFQLGFSAFHAGFTTIDVATSKLALALEYGVEGVRTGDLGMVVAKGAAKAASVPISPITNILQGSKGMSEWMKPGSQGEEIAKAIDMYRIGGGRAKMDNFYQASMWKQMQNTLKAGGEARFEGKTGESVKAYASAAWRAPFALVEQLGRPLMEYIVPRQKLGVAMDMMRLEMERMPANADIDTVRKAADRVVNSVDNRMGQMVYDNLFWNKTLKDLSMASVRSVGWNIGTIREVGGGLLDAGRFAKQEVTPKEKAEFTHRMAYTIALPIMTGLIGATYGYLHGKKPQELRDYFFPKTGEVDPQGREVRMQFPTYMKDIYHYSHDPVGTVTGKIHPMIGTIREMLMNKDYFDRDIRNSDDDFVKQMQDEITFAVKQFEPISIRQYQTGEAARQTPAEKAGAFVGVTRAPAWLGESTAEQLAGKLAGDKFKGSGTPDSERVQQIQQAKLLMRQGKEDQANAVLDGIEDAGQLTTIQRRNILRGTEHSYLENATSHLGIDSSESHGPLWRVFKVATPKERAAIADYVQKAIDRAHISEKDREELQAEFDKLMGAKVSMNDTPAAQKLQSRLAALKDLRKEIA